MNGELVFLPGWISEGGGGGITELAEEVSGNLVISGRVHQINCILPLEWKKEPSVYSLKGEMSLPSSPSPSLCISFFCFQVVPLGLRKRGPLKKPKLSPGKSKLTDAQLCGKWHTHKRAK